MKAVEKSNTMAGDRPICPTLQRHYCLPPENKQKFIETDEAQQLFGELPAYISNILKQSFLDGDHGTNVAGWEKVVKYFQENSRIIPALKVNSGTFTMLEKMYRFEPVDGPIDNYFFQSKSGGQALTNRYYAVTAKACAHVNNILAEEGICFMIDIGSGPGRNGIDMCRQHPEFNGSLKIDCIDIDPEAIQKGQELVKEHGIKQVNFVQDSMTRLGKKYPGNVDYGLLIGILCGLTYTEKIALLKAIKPYFKPGAKLMAASLLDEMAKEDLLCAYILRETTGWELQYPALGELEKAFNAAGWKYEGYFLEEPTRFYEIGIGVA